MDIIHPKIDEEQEYLVECSSCSSVQDFVDKESQQHEENICERLLNKIGFGRYQLYILLFIGFIDFTFGGEIFIQPILNYAFRNSKFNASYHDLSVMSTIFYLGMFIGCLTVGQFENFVGRKKVLTTITITGIICALVVIQFSDFALIVAIRGIYGIAAGSITTIYVTYITENVQKKHRGQAWLLTNGFYVGGQFLTILLAQVIKIDESVGDKWKVIVGWVGIPYLICGIGTVFFIKESIRFDLLKHSITRVVANFNNMYRVNGHEKAKVTEGERQELEVYQRKLREQQKTQNTMAELFNSKNRKRTLLLTLKWVQFQFVSFGAVYILTLLSTRKDPTKEQGGVTDTKLHFTHLYMAALGEVPSTLLNPILVEIKGLGRKSLVQGGAIGCAIFSYLIYTNIEHIGILILFLKFFLTVDGSTLYLYSSELYKTSYRMTALSFFVGIGCVGCIIMPSLSTMLFKISPTLPYLLFGIMALLSIIITAFLPETHKMNLDDEHDD